MVRLETIIELIEEFEKNNLHSSMVRLETLFHSPNTLSSPKFTFQYG